MAVKPLLPGEEIELSEAIAPIREVLARQQMSEQFRRAVARAKLDPARVTPHVLQHTAITGLVKKGADLPTVQWISGHKTLAMVLRCTHLSDNHIDQSVAKLDAAFAGAIAPELHPDLKEAQREAA